MTAVALAARVWREPGPANAAARALLKLQADGASVEPGDLPRDRAAAVRRRGRRSSR